MSDSSIDISKAQGAAGKEVAKEQALDAAAQEAKQEAKSFDILDPESHLRERRLDLGWIGRIFGGKDEKAGNVAVAAILMAFVMVITMTIIDAFVDAEIPYSQVVVTGGISIITAALGYVCGVDKSSNGQKPD